MMVSYIQSSYIGFGSGIVIPNTGISLQNRAPGFTLEHGHPNQINGGKRPFHTIIPSFVTRKGKSLMALGVMGGRLQPQGHVQMIVRMVDYGLNPQAALDSPRWYVYEDFSLALEPGVEPMVIKELERRGHKIIEPTPTTIFGGGQIIEKLDNDGYCAASDYRKDGQAVGY
jgi:gamma-glutamyltranspeptidase/glutathione hydrolase